MKASVDAIAPAQTAGGKGALAPFPPPGPAAVTSRSCTAFTIAPVFGVLKVINCDKEPSATNVPIANWPTPPADPFVLESRATHPPADPVVNCVGSTLDKLLQN